jgi:hypothetical protein
MLRRKQNQQERSQLYRVIRTRTWLKHPLYKVVTASACILSLVTLALQKSDVSFAALCTRPSHILIL